MLFNFTKRSKTMQNNRHNFLNPTLSNRAKHGIISYMEVQFPSYSCKIMYIKSLRVMFNEDPEKGCKYTKKSILYLVPYQNPWVWWNIMRFPKKDIVI